MKLKLVLFSFLCWTFSHAQIANQAAAVMHFDSSLVEQFSGILPSTVPGSTHAYVPDRFGNPNQAVQLFSILNYGNPVFSQMGGQDFSIAFWFRKDGSLWQERRILNKYYFDISQPGQVFAEGYTVSYNDWIGPGNMRTTFRPLTDSADVQGSMGYFQDSVWKHVALSYDRDDSLRIYVNGNVFQSRYIGHLTSFGPFFNTADLEIGNAGLSLDELYFFHKALTSSEVVELFNLQGSMAALPENEILPLQIYPNPSRENPVLTCSACRIDAFQILDLTGKVVFEERNVNGENLVYILPADHLKSGVYVIQTFQNHKLVGTKKWVVE